MLDADEIRRDFPLLSREVNGKRIVYLDSAATTQKPYQVIDAIRQYYEKVNANVHRGVYTLAEEATEGFESARRKVAAFINSPTSESIVFTRNATEAINLVANSWGRSNLKPGDEIILTEMEHHSNLVPWQLIAKERGAILKFLHITDEGTLDISELDSLLSERTRLVGVVHVSNVLGTINPVKEIVSRAHAAGALALVDGAQSVPHIPVDVQDIDCDFLVFSGHKMLGPTGIGVLYGKTEHLDRMPPFLGGGEMIRDVQLTSATYNELPWKFEAGTPDIAGAIGLGAAIDYLNSIGMENIRAYEEELTSYALQVLREIDELQIYGPPKRTGVISFCFAGVHAHDIATILDQEGVEIRAGHHCAQPLMRRLNVPATARASFYLYTTHSEVDILAEGLKKVREVFARVA